MNFYPHFLGDYDRDTKSLSLIEHGAYRLLLDHCYATEEMPPNERKELHRICKAMTPAERQAVDKVAEKFFAVNGDGRRHHKRVEEEIAKAQERAAAEAEKDDNQNERQRRHRERRKKLFEDLRARGITPAFDTTTGELERLLDANKYVPVTVTVTRDTTAIHNHTHNQNHGNSTTSPASQGKPATASQGLDCPHEKLIDLFHELLPNSPKVERWTPQRAQVMRARWRDEAKPNRDKHAGYTTIEDGLAYWRRFFTWVAGSKFLTGRTQGTGGKPPFVASLPWLIKAENFAKVIEGQYHRD